MSGRPSPYEVTEGKVEGARLRRGPRRGSSAEAERHWACYMTHSVQQPRCDSKLTVTNLLGPFQFGNFPIQERAMQLNRTTAMHFESSQIRPGMPGSSEKSGYSHTVNTGLEGMFNKFSSSGEEPDNIRIRFPCQCLSTITQAYKKERRPDSRVRRVLEK